MIGPYNPHQLCSRETPHRGHTWTLENHALVFCKGIEFKPEETRNVNTRHPGRQCGNREVHQVHNWSDSEGSYFCYGDAFMPEETVKAAPKFQQASRKEILGLMAWAERMQGQRSDREEAAEAPENRKLPVVWADKAMFEAEPIDAGAGPKVYILWMSPDPLGAIAAACKMYKGEVVRDLSKVTDEERLEYLRQVGKTKLKAPFEFVKLHILFEGVSRSFTHQLVRQRTAAYAQESLRFAVKSDMPQYAPPSILEDEESFRLWDEHNEATKEVYNKLIARGIPAEDARGRLPHDTLTRVQYTTDLRALLDHAGNRLCTQAQFEWRMVFGRLVDAIRGMTTNDPIMADGIRGVYMANELTSLFRPVCYQTGKCEFKANFDRACSIRDRVDTFAAQGVPPEDWEEGNGLSGAEKVPGIKPGEWLLDHKSARKKS